MVDFLTTAKGVGVFIAAYAIGNILGYVIPPLLDAFNTTGSPTLLSQLGQLGLILIWGLGMIVIPMFLYIKGIQTTNKQEAAPSIIIAGLIILFTLIFLFKANFVITGLANAIQDDILKGIYWVGIILTIGFGILVSSAAQIIQANTNNN